MDWTEDTLRELLFVHALELNQYVDPGVSWDRPPANAAGAAGNRPGDDFNRRASWEDVLTTHGWTAISRRGDVVFWRRPGKDGRVWSATTGHCRTEAGGDLLYVFSSSAPPFEPERCYSKFAAFTLLNHNKDYRAAARALAERGYGEGRQQKQAPEGAHQANGHPDQGGEAPPAGGKPEPEIRAEDVATIHDLIRAGSEVQWAWEQWIQNAVLNAIAAKGGTGKTRFCADLIRRVRHGLDWPDGRPMTLPPDSVGLWVVADNHHDEMVSLCRDFDIVDSVRLNASKADPYGGVTLETLEDYSLLEARIKAVRPAFVIIDTVGNATDKNLSKQEDAKMFYQPLQLIARRHRTAILCLTHLNATGQFLGRRVLEKVRIAIRMDQFEGQEKRRLEVVKSNSMRPAALGVVMEANRNEYDNSPPEPPEEGTFGKTSISPKVQQAVDWLRTLLATGPKRVSITLDSAEHAGISKGSVYRAKDILHVHEFELEGRKWWEVTASNDH